MPTQADIDIYTPLAYFSYFQYPLTAFEIWKWQFQPKTQLTFDEIQMQLEGSHWLNERISSHQGMWTIGSMEAVREQVIERKLRYVDAVKKERRLRGYINYLRTLRGVRGVALCNAMPFHFTRPESDIDLFILVKNGTLWSTRFQAVAPLIAFKQRPGEREHHSIDTSFFVSETQMQLEHFQKDVDPYFSFWIATLAPILGNAELWNQFFEQNSWAFYNLPNAEPSVRPYAFRAKQIHSLIPPFPENIMRQIQKSRLPVDLQQKANIDSCVVINEYMLKFHRTDRRDEVAAAFLENMRVCYE